jgi:hypothetical protein
MSEFIDRVHNIRGVIKNVYIQIDGLDKFLKVRSESLGKHSLESFGSWCHRSHHNCTQTYDYERNDYIAEVAGIAAMKYEVEGVLHHIRDIYVDVSDMIHCDIPINPSEDLRETGVPDNSIINIVDPEVSMDGVDEIVTNDIRLGYITERIYNVIYFGHSDNRMHPRLFYIQGRNEMYLVMRANALSSLGSYMSNNGQLLRI